MEALQETEEDGILAGRRTAGWGEGGDFFERIRWLKDPRGVGVCVCVRARARARARAPLFLFSLMRRHLQTRANGAGPLACLELAYGA